MVRRGARPPINFGGSQVTEYLVTPSGEKRVQAILSDIEPGGGSGDEPYSLPADVEFVFVLAGQLQITVAGEQITLEQGDAFTFPANIQHTFGWPRSWPHPGALGHLARPARHRPRRAAASQPPHARERDDNGGGHEPARAGRLVVLVSELTLQMWSARPVETPEAPEPGGRYHAAD